MDARYSLSKTTIEKARAVDLLSFFLSRCPDQVVRCSRNEFCLREHDSLKMSNGKWFWWSRGIGGSNAIDYLMKAEGLDFVTAVRQLTNDRTAPAPCSMPKTVKKEKPFVLPQHNFICQKAKAYLMSRGIDESLIQELIDRHLIAEENEKHGVMFIGCDEHGTPKHCSVRATDGSSEKRDTKGSEKQYSFWLESVPKSKVLRVFESAIDLLSFATLLKENGMDYHSFNLLSLAGIYGPGKENGKYRPPPALVRFLSQNPQIKQIILHLDNDAAGRSGAEGIMNALNHRYDVRYVPASHGKDYNDYLMYVHSVHHVLKGIKNGREQKEEKIRGQDHGSADSKCRS